MKAITVTLNPSFDTTLFVDGIHSDRANKVQNEITEAGGKGINVTRVIKNFGLPVEAFCIIGREDKERFFETLGDLENYHFVERAGKTRENITMRSGEMCVKINRKGDAVDKRLLDRLANEILAVSESDDIIVLSGSAPSGVNEAMLHDFCKKITSNGSKLVIDSEQMKLETLLDISPLMIKPNEYEIKTVLGLKKDDETPIETLVEEMHQKGIENILCTLGEKGMCASLNGKMYSVTPAKIEPKSTVGAGDSAVAGFVIGLLLGLEDEEILKLSSGCGTATATLEGTDLCTKDLAAHYAELTKVE